MNLSKVGMVTAVTSKRGMKRSRIESPGVHVFVVYQKFLPPRGSIHSKGLSRPVLGIGLKQRGRNSP